MQPIARVLWWTTKPRKPTLEASRFDRGWVKYLFVALDVAIISALIATRPLFPTARDLPAVTIFRAPFFPFHFVILGIWALSFSPGVVAWTGLVGAIGWMGAFLHAASAAPQSLNWTDIPANPSSEQVLRILLDPNFGGFSGHLQEAASLVVVAVLISIVMWRARETLKRQLQAERDHAALSGLFGRFVPEAVVNAMIAGRGALAPVEREATVLYSDIADFTALTDRIGATHTVAVLNAYFDEVTRIIGNHNGIVTPNPAASATAEPLIPAKITLPTMFAGHRPRIQPTMGLREVEDPVAERDDRVDHARRERERRRLDVPVALRDAPSVPREHRREHERRERGRPSSAPPARVRADGHGPSLRRGGCAGARNALASGVITVIPAALNVSASNFSCLELLVLPGDAAADRVLEELAVAGGEALPERLVHHDQPRRDEVAREHEVLLHLVVRFVGSSLGSRARAGFRPARRPARGCARR